MWSLREQVTSREDFSSLAAVSDGILIPSPPSRAGRAKRAHSRSLGGGLPVSAGSRSDLSISSRGDSRWPMVGMTRQRYDHLLCRPCVNAVNEACGCDFAISLS